MRNGLPGVVVSSSLKTSALIRAKGGSGPGRAESLRNAVARHRSRLSNASSVGFWRHSPSRAPRASAKSGSVSLRRSKPCICAEVRGTRLMKSSASRIRSSICERASANLKTNCTDAECKKETRRALRRGKGALVG